FPSQSTSFYILRQSPMELLKKIVDIVYNIVWSDILVYLCLLTGTYFSIRFRLPQLRYLSEMISLLFNSNASDKGISSFQAFSLAISGRVGTGNIAGVATRSEERRVGEE